MLNKLSLLFIFLAQVVLGQAVDVSGVVMLDGEPVLGAEIFIKKLNKGTSSKENGQFILNTIPKGEYQLQASYVGASVIVRNISSKLQKDLVVNVEKKKLSEIYSKSSSTLADNQ